MSSKLATRESLGATIRTRSPAPVAPAGHPPPPGRSRTTASSGGSRPAASSQGMTPRQGQPVRRSMSRTPSCEEGRIAPELVDREAPHQRRVGGIEDRASAHQRGDDPAPLDVGEEAHGNPGAPGEAHVRDVALAEVRLRGAPRPLDEHEVEGAGQALEALQHRGDEPVTPREVVRRFEGRYRPAVHHHLRSSVRLRLEQHRVHVHRRSEPGRARLEGLRPADFASAGARRRVVRHVLRLERSDADPAPPRDPAEPGHDHRLPDIRPRALDHERPARHHAALSDPPGAGSPWVGRFWPEA